MAVNWDVIVSVSIISVLALIIWSKISKKPIKEVILDIVDMFRSGKEEVQDRIEEVVVYE